MYKTAGQKKYSEYLKGKKWYRHKKILLKKCGNLRTCKICHTKKEIDTHHLSYRFKGKRKEIYDLVFLCRKHHYRAHAIMKERGLDGKSALVNVSQEYQFEALSRK